jgi:hypothetical protein
VLPALVERSAVGAGWHQQADFKERGIEVDPSTIDRGGEMAKDLTFGLLFIAAVAYAQSNPTLRKPSPGTCL